MNTPSPAPRRITKQDPPVFPCELYYPGDKNTEPFWSPTLHKETWSNGMSCFTHWRPLPTAPTCVPATEGVAAEPRLASPEHQALSEHDRPTMPVSAPFPATDKTVENLLSIVDYDKKLAAMTPKELILEVLGTTAADYRCVNALMQRVLPNYETILTDEETEAACPPSPERVAPISMSEVPSGPASRAAPGLREAVEKCADYCALMSWQKNFILAAITPVFAKLEAELAGYLTEQRRLGDLLDKQEVKYQAELAALRTVIAKKDEALQSIADETVRHHEHNESSKKDRLPVGYSIILNTADQALALTPKSVRDELAASRAEVEWLKEANEQACVYIADEGQKIRGLKELSITQDIEASNLRAQLAAAESALAEVRNHLTIILPMAKGYAAEHPVGNNQTMVNVASKYDNARRTP